MKTTIITDAACDLSSNLIEDYNIQLLPVKIIKGDKVLYDSKDINFTTEIREDLKTNGKHYSTKPLEPDEIKDFLIKVINKSESDNFLFILSSSTRSETFNNVVNSMSKFIPEARIIRANKGIKNNIKVEVIDSMQLSTGLGIIISEAILNLKKGLEFPEIIEKVNQSIEFTQAFLIPETLTQLYSNANNKGDKSVNLSTYILGSALDIKPIIQCYKGQTRHVDKIKGFDKALEMIVKLIISDIRNNRLKFKNVAISYGGDSQKRKELIESKIIMKLKEIADENHVTITLSKMGSTMMVNVGPNAISIGYMTSNIVNPE